MSELQVEQLSKKVEALSLTVEEIQAAIKDLVTIVYAAGPPTAPQPDQSTDGILVAPETKSSGV